MTETFFHEQSIFLIITFAILCIPGWFFILAFFHRNHFALIEKFILSVPLSFTIVTLGILTADSFGLTLTKNNIISVIGVMIFCLFAFSFKRKEELPHNKNSIFTFTKTQTVLITLLIIFTIIIKSIFLINAIFPTATDLGHHMFWVEKIAQEQSLQNYEKIDVVIDGNNTSLSEPEKIADFIVGEHIIFAVIKILTNKTTISTFPSLVLFVFNIFTILTIFILTRRLFDTYKYGSVVAILALLFVGPLWAISGAGAKFVSGGVIGNVIGNLLIPTIIYFLYRAFRAREALFLIPAIVTTTALAYTHHLSSFIFGYIFLFSILAYIIFQKDGLNGYRNIFALLKNYYVIPLLFIAIVSLFFLHPPSYLDSESISSSVGAPSKSTRTGIPFSQLMYTLGEARFVFGVIGLVILTISLFIYRISKYEHISKKYHPLTIYGSAFLVGWCGALLGMSMFPHILQVNIISSRIATYSVFPLAILAGFSLVWIVAMALRHKDNRMFMPQMSISIFLLISFIYVFSTGMRDNATSLNDAPKTNSALQTFHVGNYASKVFSTKVKNGNFWMVKDHNYITSDTWLKVFFADDYSFPLSRSYFKRYETNPDREHCTLHMISSPTSSEAQKCFTDLSVKTVLVNTEQDAAQFLRSENFSRIYQNNELSLFVRK